MNTVKYFIITGQHSLSKIRDASSRILSSHHILWSQVALMMSKLQLSSVSPLSNMFVEFDHLYFYPGFIQFVSIFHLLSAAETHFEVPGFRVQDRRAEQHSVARFRQHQEKRARKK